MTEGSYIDPDILWIIGAAKKKISKAHTKENRSVNTPVLINSFLASGKSDSISEQNLGKRTCVTGCKSCKKELRIRSAKL